MISVKVKEGESVDRALKRFKKKYEKARVLKELRARSYYEKESDKRRKEIKKAAYKQHKQQSEDY